MWKKKKLINIIIIKIFFLISVFTTPKGCSTQMVYLDVVFNLLTSFSALFSFLISNRCCSFCCGFWWPFSRAISSSCFCMAYEETNQLFSTWRKVLQLKPNASDHSREYDVNKNPFYWTVHDNFGKYAIKDNKTPAAVICSLKKHSHDILSYFDHR